MGTDVALALVKSRSVRSPEPSVSAKGALSTTLSGAALPSNTLSAALNGSFTEFAFAVNVSNANAPWLCPITE